jgi:KaiC/GvpD/RAD55 family RecA-like ATPase
MPSSFEFRNPEDHDAEVSNLLKSSGALLSLSRRKSRKYRQPEQNGNGLSQVSRLTHPGKGGTVGTDGTLVSGLTVKPMNKWLEEAAMSPIPKMLLSELVVENEVTILFGETASNKTVLSVQIAEWAAGGREIRGFVNDAGKEKVLFLDCELSAKQQEKRYSELLNGADYFSNHYKFSDLFDRAELSLDKCPKGMDLKDYVFLSIEMAIVDHGYNFLIVDNISALGSHTEQAKFAIPLMQAINHVKRKHAVTVLTLAHTPKRDSSRPLLLNDLQGSASLRNLCDAVFAIGKSQKDAEVRYIKQLKPRSVDMVYGEDNVIVCHLSKDANFLGLEVQGYSAESEHLSIRTDDEKQELTAKVRRLHDSGKSLREIAIETGVAKSTVSRMVSRVSQYPEKEAVGQYGTPVSDELCAECKKHPALNHGVCVFCATPINGDK